MIIIKECFFAVSRELKKALFAVSRLLLFHCDFDSGMVHRSMAVMVKSNKEQSLNNKSGRYDQV